MSMLIHFVDKNRHVIDALKNEFRDLETEGTIQITQGDLREFVSRYPVIISAANSFGIMDGGSDKVYLDVFGNSIQSNLRSTIRSIYYGESSGQWQVERHWGRAHQLRESIDADVAWQVIS